VHFVDASCSSPVCNPSRNALWSGYRPSTTRIWSNGNNPEGNFFRDVPGFGDAVSMHQLFRQNGYFTYAGGKLYHKGKMGNPETDPNNWDELYTAGTGSPGGNLYKWEGNYTVKWSAGDFALNTANDVKLANAVADKITNYASSPQSNQPFFIACGFFRPHLPWNVHKDFVEMYDPDSLTIPAGFLANDLNDINGANATGEHSEIVAQNQWINGVRAYLANCSFADYNVGIVLDALRNSPYANNTIVCFMGDHGWHLGEKSRWRKFSVYDIANRTSLMIYDPSAPGNGQICSKVVSLQDLYPTLAELAGINKPPSVEGNSLAPLLQDPDRTDWEKPIYISYAGKHIIKTNQYRLVDDDADSQLYDVVNDPYEWTNLYGDPTYQGVILQLRSRLDSLVLRSSTIRDSLQNRTSIDENHVSPEGRIILNPLVTAETLMLDLEYAGHFVDLRVLDVKGQEVLKMELMGEAQVPLQLPALPPGYYFLTVESEGRVRTEKFLIQ
ncbi:MAG: sulfatase-like hydrolase/transferase, partial [Bacteroidota bacterium]